MLSVGTLVTGALTDLAANASATGSAWTTAFQSLQTATSSSINDISSLRATVGSAINQLGYINNNLVAQSANEQAARSTIVDTNYSAETSELTKGQILQQAATAMLAQANQMPNVILSLLK
jgi:flagellin